jgi:hypothetical protein
LLYSIYKAAGAITDCPWASVWHLMESSWFARSTAPVARGACCHRTPKAQTKALACTDGYVG